MKRKIINLLAATMVMAWLVSCVQEKGEPVSKEILGQLTLLPNDADFPGHINMKEIQNSPFFAVLMDSLAGNPEKNQKYRDFLEATGFDLQKDIDEVYAAAVFDSSGHKVNGLLIARGKFNSQRIIAYIESQAMKDSLLKESYAGYTIYHGKRQHSGFCFANENTIAGGDVNRVKAWLDNKNKLQHDADAGRQLKDLISQLRYGNSSWFVFDTGSLLRDIEDENLPKGINVFRNIKTISASLKIGENLRIYGTSEMADKEKAEMLGEAIKGFIATAKLSVSDDRDTVDILNKLQVESNGTTVSVSYELSREDVEKLIHKKNSMNLSMKN